MIKNFSPFLQQAFKHVPRVSQFTLLSISCLLALQAHASSTSATFTTSMSVTAPVCTVVTSSATLSLTPGMTTQTIGAFFTAAGLVTTAQYSNWLTSAALNQTATITCSLASTPITSFVVAPASGAVLNASYAAQAVLADSSSTPSGIRLVYEQVSVNGVAAPMAYNSGGTNVSANSTVFSTTAVANGTATVVWRPAFYFTTALTALVGTPGGGSFSTPGQIIVNY